MIYEVQEYFGLERDFHNAGYFDTESYRRMFANLKRSIENGRTTALTGIVGSGKTIAARRVRKELKEEGKILVAGSLIVEQHRITLKTLLVNLFIDLAINKKDRKIPSDPTTRNRKLQELIRRRNKPIALFIDEAHDLSHSSLRSLKRANEIVEDAEGVISIVLVGHPKLKTDLKLPFMEEIGGRANIIELNWIKGQERDYLQWLLSQCSREELKAEDIFNEEAADMLSQRLSTPLQINSYAWRALEAAYLIGQKPVKADTVDMVISEELNGLKARIWRYGYDMKSLCEAIDAKPSEVKAFLRGRLPTGRSQELKNEISKLGIAG